MYAYWVCAARETPIFSPKYPFRSILFSQITKNPFRSITILHFRFGSAAGQQPARAPARRILAVPETRIFTLKTDQARSGAPHFQAQNDSSSFRSPHFHARELVPEPGPIFHFAAAHTYQFFFFFFFVGGLDPAFALVMCVRAHNLFAPPPSIENPGSAPVPILLTSHFL